MSIDMSSAFDTISRCPLLEILSEAGCDEDELRLVRVLISGTQLTVRVGCSLSEAFSTNVGTPQGDALSPILFTCYLAACLKKVRLAVGLPSSPLPESIPREAEYADDVDMFSTQQDELQNWLPTIKDILSSESLLVNEAKTTFTRVHVDPDPEKRGKEDWRTQRVLGSLLGSEADMKRRCNLTDAAFAEVTRLWSQKSVRLRKRIRIYNAICLSILMYNSACLALTKSQLKSLDVCHRKHLRRILGIKWPRKISNRSLYQKCNAVPVSTLVADARWRMLGHVLRLPPETPAHAATYVAATSKSTGILSKTPGRRGRHRTNLYGVIKKDLVSRGLKLTCKTDMKKLTGVAKDKRRWREMRPMHDT